MIPVQIQNDITSFAEAYNKLDDKKKTLVDGIMFGILAAEEMEKVKSESAAV